jgi:hypothetical protein
VTRLSLSAFSNVVDALDGLTAIEQGRVLTAVRILLDVDRRVVSQTMPTTVKTEADAAGRHTATISRSRRGGFHWRGKWRTA